MPSAALTGTSNPHHRQFLLSFITSGDAFLAGVSSCGVTLVERAARDMGIPLQRMEVTIDGMRDRNAPTTFARVEMHFRLVGVTQEQAETLVGRYKDG